MTRKLLALLAALCLLLGVTACGGEQPPASSDNSTYAFYLKDGEMMMMNTADRQSTAVTAHLNLLDSSSVCAAMLQLTEDQHRMFYIDSEEDADDPVQWLYTRELLNPNAAPQKLGRSDGLYKISRDGQAVLYLQRNDNGGFTLCLHNLTAETQLTDQLNGFGFTVNDDWPFYSVDDDGETHYVVMSGNETLTLTATEFHAQTGGERTAPYTFDFDLRSSGCLLVNGAVVDRDKPYTGHGWESTFHDRLLYFTYSEADPDQLTLKQYVLDGEVQVIDQLPRDQVPLVGYATDGSPLYITNYDRETRQGDLMLYQDGRSILLDSGVTAPVSFSTVTNFVYSALRHIVW